ncbi:hypothetical protein GCM10018987_04710 [Streptomyces cremeus]
MERRTAPAVSTAIPETAVARERLALFMCVVFLRLVYAPTHLRGEADRIDSGPSADAVAGGSGEGVTPFPGDPFMTLAYAAPGTEGGM